MTESWFSFVLGAFLVIGLLTGLLVLIVISRLEDWRHALLQREGVRIQAEVLDTVVEEGGFWVYYRFRLERGGVWTGADWVTPEQLDRPRTGSRIDIVYLPSRPDISLLAVNCVQPTRGRG